MPPRRVELLSVSKGGELKYVQPITRSEHSIQLTLGATRRKFKTKTKQQATGFGFVTRSLESQQLIFIETDHMHS